jgi:hypothetical protein
LRGQSDPIVPGKGDSWQSSYAHATSLYSERVLRTIYAFYDSRDEINVEAVRSVCKLGA